MGREFLLEKEDYVTTSLVYFVFQPFRVDYNLYETVEDGLISWWSAYGRFGACFPADQGQIDLIIMIKVFHWCYDGAML